MPDVTRSDSQRSDGSNRPRVSFNRDVHIKRIVPNETSRIAGALTNDGSGHLIPSPVRKARLPKSKQQLAEEAARILQQVDKVNCVVKNHNPNSTKFYTLPVRKKHKGAYDYQQSSLDRKTRRRNSEETINRLETPPKKPPRTFAHYSKPEKTRTSIFNIFKREKDPQELKKKSNLRRSVSDATHLKSKNNNIDNVNNNKSKIESETEEDLKRKKLNPIVEDVRGKKYSSRNKENINFDEHKENVGKNKTQSVTEQLKEYIDEVDSALFNETGIRVNPPKNTNLPEIVIIDVDKAEKISRRKDKPKLTATNITKKIKSFGNKTKKLPKKKDPLPPQSPRSPRIKEVISNLENSSIQPSSTMMHSSQKPVDKLPLTRGRTVDSMVKRLSTDKNSPSPPKTNVMITPSVTVQHNNNQPFSYTRGHSPERNYRSTDGSRSPEEPGSPVIYAHVVCDKSGQNNSTPIKQTVHTTYSNNKKHLPHSDSDEGLGNEENLGFAKKYDSEKTVTHFGDDYLNGNRYRYDEEYPITPKVKNDVYNYNEYGKTEHTIFIDSSSRGRGDGMDSKRRESLTEHNDNGFNSLKYNVNTSRTDLSARRDLLESRINRRLEEKNYRQSPPSNGSPFVSKYVSEAKYYKHGSASPVGYIETYTTETTTDRNGNRNTKETRLRKDLSDKDRGQIRYKYETEPKSFDSQMSDYRSSYENVENVSTRRIDSTDYKHVSNKFMSKDERQRLNKDREHYRSNPEIIQRSYENYDDQETYHDSLKREKHEGRTSTPKHRPERKYFDRTDFDRKDRLGDSGIENDFKRDLVEHYRRPRASVQKGEYCNESEDEGFASSLLIASERQHTEENINNRKTRNGYESDRGYRDDPYRNVENMEYQVTKEYAFKDKYAPRERSIDDGSHYDPRLDKDFDAERSTLKKKTDKKPPKPEKKSSLEKVKQLFSRDSSKKKKQKDRIMVPTETLRARYTEYTGSREHLEPKAVKSEIKSGYDYSNRRRLSTPSPSPTREVQRNVKSEATHGSWFKSLDRLSRKKSKKDEIQRYEEEIVPKPAAPTKNLRFFGDTDVESNDSLREQSSKVRSSLSNSNYTDRVRSQSNRDLKNISTEERRSPNNQKSLLNISEIETKSSRLNVKPPMSPNHRPSREENINKEDRGRRRRNEVSSVESSTEGDSSQQSQRSVVYLHAATVGDIPGPGYLKNGRRATSREELISNGSSTLKPQVKTLSRSFSVLAPWKPRYVKESYDIDYTQYPKQIKNGKYEQKISRNTNSRKDNSSTLKKKANETRRSNQSASTLNRSSRNKNNVSSYSAKKSQEDLNKGSSSTLYRKKERQSKENLRYSSRDKDEKKISSKSMSVESLSHDRRNRNDNRDISRSVSMPRDPEKSAGWFKMTKKSKKSLSSQRL